MVSFLVLSSYAIKTINWAGYKWVLRDDKQSGPGPNNWSSKNVWVDSSNRLHLKLSYSQVSGWTCAELYSEKKFGFGTYRWFVEGAIDRFDPNTVLGLFTYAGVDSVNEIDIEMALWGQTKPEASNLFYTIYPSTNAVKQVSSGMRMRLQGTYTTHQFVWTRENVKLQSQNGFPNSPQQNVFFKYQTPASFARNVPVLSVPLHMNLWLFQGKPPADGKEVEIIIHDFKYTK
ncbi:hypothetical protein Bhyg_11375 [Pseudolycoriella hygida]|uniref:GH16 domain-containing protein n=1 Tax=Pseudolycoriella hygida TaxID=35572 RepID=A0A9Q0S059_9DIPT|nr:hypothetical protein Bhyg_11375 [Pseudolycoriella hygida]